MKNKIYMHFSVDDVFNSLIEITDKNIPLKNHWFFSQIYRLWKKYKIRTGLYIFYKGKINGKIRYLSEVKSLKDQLKENWIYFGPHALDFNSPPHKFSTKDQKKHVQQIYKEIHRFAGNKYYTKNVRLHEYSECYELSNLFKNYKVNTLFSTDKNVGSHRLSNKYKNDLLIKGKTKYKNINFIRTNFRIENLNNNIIKNHSDFSKFFESHKLITIYTHEYELKKKRIKKLLNDNIALLYKNFKFSSIKP